VTEKTDNSIQDITAKALQLTAATGLEAGCQLIEAEGVSIDAALAYKEFAQALYRQNKNVQHMIDAGQRGIEFALDHAARAKKRRRRNRGRAHENGEDHFVQCRRKYLARLGR
jgi:hypothetical protein